MDGGLPWLQATGGASDHPHKYDDVAVNFADTVFGFWEDVQASSENSSYSGHYQDDVDDDESFCAEKSNKAFWEEQHQLLQTTLRRTSSLETKIREATKEAVRELSKTGMQCICRRLVAAKGCRSCFRREICDRLLSLGYNCAICKSKWRSSSKIPSGEHTYLEVMDESHTKRGEAKVVIELNFRGEFEMGGANEQYKQLISRLPEVYVGKAERLQVLIKILCSAAKQCRKENNMHLAPWRKHKYMRAKWLGTCQRSAPGRPLPTGYSVRPLRPKASMLTCDLVENIPALHCTTVVEVV